MPLVGNRARLRLLVPRSRSVKIAVPVEQDPTITAGQWFTRSLLIVLALSIPVCFVLGYANLGRLGMNLIGALCLSLVINLVGRSLLYRSLRRLFKRSEAQVEGERTSTSSDSNDKASSFAEDDKQTLDAIRRGRSLDQDVSALGAYAPLYVGGEILLTLVSSLAILPFVGVGSEATIRFFSNLWNGTDFGPVYIQVSSLIGGLGLFLLLWLMLRWLKAYLRARVFPYTDWDEGVRDAILATITYSGFALIILTAASAAGVDMSRLAIVAGALSVGIGFGLQTIVSNIVSGLILLYERSIKPGDWVQVDGGVEGIIRQVKVRYTEIETFERSTVMVPNSSLVGGSVTNMTHKNRLGRVQVDIGIDYAANPRDVMKVLKEAVTDMPFALKDPAPFVHFNGFGASSIDFAVKIYLANVDDCVSARTEMAMRIYEVLKANDINVPFNQLEVKVHDFENLRSPS